MHAGGKSSADANGLLGALQDMFVLRCYVSSEHSTAEGRFWATKTLRDNALTIGRWN
jgi:hypothetical protein